MNRLKNILILIILLIFLLSITIIPVSCIFKQFTGIYCPGCGMTRAFYSILSFNFVNAFFYNILSIPLFIFLIIFIYNLIIDVVKNRFSFIPILFKLFSKYYIVIIVLLFFSFLFNNLKQ